MKININNILVLVLLIGIISLSLIDINKGEGSGYGYNDDFSIFKTQAITKVKGTGTPLQKVSVTKYSNYLKVSNLNDYGEMTCCTTSMSPVLNPRDIVIEDKYKGQQLKVGMIIKQTCGGEPIIHRIVGLDYDKNKNLIGGKTKGDNNPNSEYFKLNCVTHIVRGVVFSDWEYDKRIQCKNY